MIKVDIVSPVFNEELGISEFLVRVEKISLSMKSNADIRILLVDDGSTDKTWEIINAIKLSIPLHLVKLSRNFGHQAAVWAGLESCRADAFVIVMDSDLQDPPEAIREIIQTILTISVDVILMRRKTRDDSYWKKFFARTFYLLQSHLTNGKIEMNVGDFFCLSPRARLALLNHKESVKYIRGLVTQIGFNQLILDFDRAKRSHGVTHYSIKQMFTLAVSGITGFTVGPLIFVVYGALFGSLVTFCMVLYILYLKLFSGVLLQPGWAFLSITLLSLSTLILLSLAIISLYLARVTQELKARPIYIKSREIDSSETEYDNRGL